MRKIHPIILLIVAFLSANASDPMKGLHVKNGPDGIVVFALPTKMERYGSTTATKPLQYDVTASSGCDSVFVTCSVETVAPIKSESASLANSTNSISCPVEYLYVEPVSGGWKSRLKISVALSDFSNLTNWEESPIITVGGATYKDSAKKWNERRNVYRMIIEILKQNKR